MECLRKLRVHIEFNSRTDATKCFRRLTQMTAVLINISTLGGSKMTFCGRKVTPRGQVSSDQNQRGIKSVSWQIIICLCPVEICTTYRYLRLSVRKRYLRKRAPSEDSDQTARLRSLIRVFAGSSFDGQRQKMPSAEQGGFWSDCMDVLMCRLIWVFHGQVHFNEL